MKKWLIPILMLKLGLAHPLVAARADREDTQQMQALVELLRTGECETVFEKVHAFLEEYPDSPYTDRISMMAGDYKWGQGHYLEALSYYDRIQSQVVLDQCFDKRIDCLYHAGQHDRVVNGLYELSSFPINSEAAAARVFQYASSLAHLNRHQEAIDQFRRLDNTVFATQAKLACAQNYYLQGNLRDSIALYLELAEAFPDKREAFLLKAESLKHESQQPEHAGQLAQVQHLFALDRHEDVWNQRSVFATSLPESQHRYLNFLVGRSAFASGRYLEAQNLLLPLLGDDDIDQNILMITLIETAQKLRRLEKAQPWLELASIKFPNNAHIGLLWIAQAEAFRTQGRHKEALIVLDRAMTYPLRQEEQGIAALHRIMLLCEQGRWSDCHSRAGELIYQLSFQEKTDPSLFKVLAKCTEGILSGSYLTEEERRVLQTRLASELKIILGQPLPSDEKAVYLLKLAKIEYAKGKLAMAASTAQEFLEAFPNHEHAYKAHLMIAYCNYESKEETDYSSFITHAEKALSLANDLPGQNMVRQNLFAAYLKEGLKAGETLKDGGTRISRAADHLFNAYMNRKEDLKEEQLLWLARYFYVHVDDEEDLSVPYPLPESKRRVFAERSLALFQDANFEASREPERLEDLVVLSQLYGWLGKAEEQKKLLKDVLQMSWPSAATSHYNQDRLRLTLAHLCQKDGELSIAKDLCHQILENNEQSDDYIREASQLLSAQINYDTLPLEQRVGNGAELKAILGQLRGIELRHLAAHEPLHLEAAWTRVHMQAVAVPEPSHDEKLLTLLLKAKKNLTEEEAASYKKDDNAAGIYQAYLTLFDARIAHLEANIAGTRKRLGEQQTKREAAKILYSKLIDGSSFSTKYLIAQAQAGLDQLP